MRLGWLLALMALPAAAEEITVNVLGAVDPNAPSAWFGPGPIPATLDLNFTFDTQSAPIVLTFAPANGTQYLAAILSNALTAASVTASADGTTLWSLGNSRLNMFGNPTESGLNTVFNTGFGVARGAQGFMWDAAASTKGFPIADFQADPLAMWMNKVDSWNTNVLTAFGPFGFLEASSATSVTVSAAPEPATLALLFLALGALTLNHRRTAR
jgi:hypothetical protein